MLLTFSHLTNFASSLLVFQNPFKPYDRPTDILQPHHSSASSLPCSPSTSISPFTLSQSSIDTQAPSCPIDGPVSCHNSTAAPDSCCFIYPGGQLLSTQFWDTSPAVGPQDSWTLHGLWPDLCDGSYPTYCTFSPAYTNITAILESSSNPNAASLLSYMSIYWLPNSGTAARFWTHEWTKHGTCVNTISPSCYPASSYNPGDEVVDYFARAVELFKSLDTYQALGKKGIWPNFYARHTRQEIEDALREVTGKEVVLGCRRGELNQAWYSFNVQGSLQTGDFKATEPVGKSGRGSCPERGIRYLPKGRRRNS